jgi:hypothetical protein
MNFLATAATSITVAIGSIAGCQPPPSDQFQPGIPVVEQAPIPVYTGGHASEPATRIVCTTQVREASGITEPEPGCRLNVYMSLDTIDGVTPEQRCLNRGGTPRYLNPLINCVNVDF